MEEVQSVVLEKKVREFSANQISTENDKLGYLLFSIQKYSSVSHFKLLKFQNLPIAVLMKKCSRQLWKILVQIQRSNIHVQNFSQIRPIKFSKKRWVKNMDIESFCTKTKMLIEILTQEIMTVALTETEFGYQDNSHQFSISGQYGPSGFRIIELKALFGNQIFFYDKKVAIDNLMDEIQPVILENKRLDSQEKSKTFALSSALGS